MVNPQNLRPGTIIYVWVGIYRHKGLVSNRWCSGMPKVLANAASSGVAEIPWDDFTTDLPCYVEGYPSTLHPLQVLYNGRTMIGQPYSVSKFNCEHFVYKAHGQHPHSPQFVMSIWVTIGIGISLVAAAQS